MYLHLTRSSPTSLTNKRQVGPGQAQFLLPKLHQRLAKSSLLCRTSVPCSSQQLRSSLQQQRTLRADWRAPCVSLHRGSPCTDSLTRQCRQTSTHAQGSLQSRGQNNSQLYHEPQSGSVTHPSLTPEQGLEVRWNREEENPIKHPE